MELLTKFLKSIFTLGTAAEETETFVKMIMKHIIVQR